MNRNELFVVFETAVGSQVYGFSTPESDTDIRGVAIPPIRYLLGEQSFDQYETKEPDLVIYSIKKAVKLIADNNPNMIELLYIPRKYWTHVDPLWLPFVEHRDWFLCKRVGHSFTGYAASQLKRIRGHKRWLDNPPKEAPSREAMGLPPSTKIMTSEQIQAANSLPTDALTEGLHAEVQKELEYARRVKEWNDYQTWIKERNPKRQELEARFSYDTKHATHLIRLMRQGEEMLRTGDLIVDRRGIDADELFSIRNGAWPYEKVVAYAEEMDAKIKELAKISNLQDKPRHKDIDGLLVDTLRKYYRIPADVL